MLDTLDGEDGVEAAIGPGQSLVHVYFGKPVTEKRRGRAVEVGGNDIVSRTKQSLGERPFAAGSVEDSGIGAQPESRQALQNGVLDDGEWRRLRRHVSEQWCLP